MTTDKLFRPTMSGPLSSRVKFMRLSRAGHVNKMPRDHLPHIIMQCFERGYQANCLPTTPIQ